MTRGRDIDSANVSDHRLSHWEQKRQAAFLLLVVCVIGAILRGAVAYHGGIWADESFLLLVIRLPSWAAMFDFLRYHESHPPFFYVLMRMWGEVFGQGDKVLLALPILIGVAIIPAVYLCAAKVFNARVALLSCALAAVSPTLIEYSSQLRPYGLLPLLALCSCYSLARAVSSGSARPWAGYVASTSLMLYTHNWSWLVVFGHAVALCVLSFARLSEKRMWRDAAIAWLAIGVIYLPWLATFVYQTRHAGHSPVVVESAWQLVEFVVVAVPGSLIMMLFSAFSDRPWGMIASVVLAAAIAALTSVTGGRTSTRSHGSFLRADDEWPTSRVALAVFLIVPAATTAAAIAISPRTNMVLARCLVMLTPMLLIAISFCVDRAISARWSRPLVGATAGLLCWFVTTSILCDEFLLRSVRSNAREVASVAANSIRLDDLLIVAPEWYAAPFNHYFAGGVEQIDFPHPGIAGPADFSHVYERISDPAPLRVIRRQIDEAKKSGRRVLLISERQYMRPPTNDDVLRATRYHQAALMSVVRVSQIRRYLEEQYGTPDSIRVAHEVTRYEELVPYLYVAGHVDTGSRKSWK